MNIRHKRKWAARLQLTVFISMVLLSAIHRHEFQPQDSDHCEECVQHVPHAGHFLTHVNHAVDCVLCQFLQISYVVATVLASLLFCFIMLHDKQPKMTFWNCGVAILSTRAPPLFV